MFNAYLTLFTAFAVAGIAGWFSIIGIMTIYAAGPMYALVMGIVLEIAKLVTASWLYREWKHTSWTLKIPLMYFVIALMVITSAGVFGFLSKLYLEQGSSTLNNVAKVERLNEQIAREKTLIASNDKVIAQLDATLDSYLGNDRADRSVTIRRRQEPQRIELRASTIEVQQRIDAFTDEKFVLESEVRKLELEVGPIRYVAQIIYGSEAESRTTIESAVRSFTLIIVSTLDPLAVLLLIAANQSLLRYRVEKKKTISPGEAPFPGQPANPGHVKEDPPEAPPASAAEAVSQTAEQEGDTVGFPDLDWSPTEPFDTENAEIQASLPEKSVGLLNEKETTTVAKDVTDTEEIGKSGIHDVADQTRISEHDQVVSTVPEIRETIQDEITKIDFGHITPVTLANIRQPKITRVTQLAEDLPAIPELVSRAPWAAQATILEELLGNNKHFVPTRVLETPKENVVVKPQQPKIHGWLKEFKR
jgi:hypothetical protein